MNMSSLEAVLIANGYRIRASSSVIPPPPTTAVVLGGAEPEPGLKKGPWAPDEDQVVRDYVKKYGEGNWGMVCKRTGLRRCGKSVRLRWTNHLRPNLKKTNFTKEEVKLIYELHAKYGNKWARIARKLPGRTDNEVKNFWNANMKRKKNNKSPVNGPESPRELNQISIGHHHTNLIPLSSLTEAVVFSPTKNCYKFKTSNSGLLPKTLFEAPFNDSSSSSSNSLINVQTLIPPTMHNPPPPPPAAPTLALNANSVVIPTPIPNHFNDFQYPTVADNSSVHNMMWSDDVNQGPSIVNPNPNIGHSQSQFTKISTGDYSVDQEDHNIESDRLLQDLEMILLEGSTNVLALPDDHINVHNYVDGTNSFEFVQNGENMHNYMDGNSFDGNVHSNYMVNSYAHDNDHRFELGENVQSNLGNVVAAGGGYYGVLPWVDESFDHSSTGLNDYALEGMLYPVEGNNDLPIDLSMHNNNSTGTLAAVPDSDIGNIDLDDELFSMNDDLLNYTQLGAYTMLTPDNLYNDGIMRVQDVQNFTDQPPEEAMLAPFLQNLFNADDVMGTQDGVYMY